MWFRSWVYPLLATALFFVVSCQTITTGDVAYLIRQPEPHPDITITFAYDESRERNILDRIGWEGRIITWQIECTDRYFFFRPFSFEQGDQSTRPVLCLQRKYLCDRNAPDGGFVFQGYLYLDEAYDLREPVTITLADKVIRVIFQP
jgi:hypothetical protein